MNLITTFNKNKKISKKRFKNLVDSNLSQLETS